MAFLVFSLSIIFITFLAFKVYQRLRFKLPPGPLPLPFVGNLYKIKPLRCRCFAQWAKIYGPIFTVYMGSQVNVVITTEKLAKEVLKENDQQLADRYRTRASSMMSRNGKDLIWADYGAHYVKVRKLCNLELFAPKRLEALRPIREDEVTAMVESIFKNCTIKPDITIPFDIDYPESKGKSLVLREYLAPVSFNNITRLAFGKRFMDSEGVIDEQGQIMKGIVTNGIKIGAKLSTAEHVPWLRWMFMVENEELIKHNARRDKLTRIIMEEHTLAREKSGNTKQHFVDALLTLQKEYDLSEDTIIGLLWDMITAGMDTTTISVEWAMAELVTNPRVQRKAQDELDKVIGPNRVMQESNLSNLPYLQYIAKEALRLHPPTPLMLPHKASTNVKICGYDIPKGSVAHVNVWAIGRDPEIWKDPLEFRPERFIEEDVDMKGHDYRLLPFGAGRRVCPGAQLAINLVTSMLGHLLHHFSWSPPEGILPGDIDLTESPGTVTYMASPLQVVATPRLDSNLYKRIPTTNMSL